MAKFRTRRAAASSSGFCAPATACMAVAPSGERASTSSISRKNCSTRRPRMLSSAYRLRASGGSKACSCAGSGSRKAALRASSRCSSASKLALVVSAVTSAALTVWMRVRASGSTTARRVMCRSGSMRPPILLISWISWEGVVAFFVSSWAILRPRNAKPRGTDGRPTPATTHLVGATCGTRTPLCGVSVIIGGCM